MTITAVIAEYNPFHNGHAYQLAKARELTGADYLVVIMSGDFVQRGAPAILDQHDRAELALLGGAGVSYDTLGGVQRRGPYLTASVSLCTRQCTAFRTRGGIASYCAWLRRFSLLWQ